MAKLTAADRAASIRAWKRAHPEKVAAYNRRDRDRYPERFKVLKKRHRAKHLIRLREEDKLAARKRRAAETPQQKSERYRRAAATRLAKREAEAGRPRPEACDICASARGKGGAIVFDHCHKKGHFRGWICDRCNKTLGHVADDPGLLRRMAAYLEKAK